MGVILMPTGASVAYISGEGHLPLPAAGAGYRAAHTPATRKPSGLDWAALRPKCRNCQSPSGQLGDDSLCPVCLPAPVVATSTPATTGPTRRLNLKQVTRTEIEATTGRRIDREAIIRLYTAGMSVPKVRDELGYAFGTIRRALTEAGIELRDDRKNNGPRARSPKPPRTDVGRSRRSDRITLDTAAVVAAYDAGQTLTQIATTHGCSHLDVARHLDDAGVVRRGAPTVVTTDLVAQVRDLYTCEHLTQAQVADHLNLTVKVVQNIMAKHNIQPRPAAHLGGLPGVDRAVALKDQIRGAGVTSREIKAWGLRQGLLLEHQPGIPPARVVDAYLSAHAHGCGR